MRESDALALHDRLLALDGGAGVREPDLLKSALAPPQQIYAYGNKPDIVDMAAALTVGIIRNHPFVDEAWSVSITAQNVGNCVTGSTGTFTIDSTVADSTYGGVLLVGQTPTANPQGPCFAGSGSIGGLSNGVYSSIPSTAFSTFSSGTLQGGGAATAADLVALDDGTYIETGDICSDGANAGTDCLAGYWNATTFDVIVTGSGASTQVELVGYAPVGSGGYPGTYSATPITFNTAVTPEPASYFLFGTGLLLLGGIVRKRIGLRHTV